MLEMLPAPQDDVLAFRIDGEVTDDQYDALIAVMEDKLQRHDRLRAYGEWVAFEGMPFQTYLKDVAQGFKHWNDFSKAVIVTDKEWVERSTRALGKVAPKLKTRTFPFEERDQAVDWLLQEG